MKKYDFIYNKKFFLPEFNNFADAGSRLHSLINYYYKGQNIDKLIAILGDDEKIFMDNFIKLGLSAPLCSEYSFFVQFEGVWLTGRMDAIFYSDGKIIIADWKTGNFSHGEDEIFQTIFYLYAASEIFIKKGIVSDFSDISMVYYLLKDSSSIKIDFDETLFCEFKKKLKKILEKINYGRYNSDSHTHCKACEYKNLCKDNLPQE